MSGGKKKLQEAETDRSRYYRSLFVGFVAKAVPKRRAGCVNGGVPEERGTVQNELAGAVGRADVQ